MKNQSMHTPEEVDALMKPFVQELHTILPGDQNRKASLEIIGATLALIERTEELSKGKWEVEEVRTDVLVC